MNLILALAFLLLSFSVEIVGRVVNIDFQYQANGHEPDKLFPNVDPVCESEFLKIPLSLALRSSAFKLFPDRFIKSSSRFINL